MFAGGPLSGLSEQPHFLEYQGDERKCHILYPGNRLRKWQDHVSARFVASRGNNVQIRVSFGGTRPTSRRSCWLAPRRVRSPNNSTSSKAYWRRFSVSRSRPLLRNQRGIRSQAAQMILKTDSAVPCLDRGRCLMV